MKINARNMRGAGKTCTGGLPIELVCRKKRRNGGFYEKRKEGISTAYGSNYDDGAWGMWLQGERGG